MSEEEIQQSSDESQSSFHQCKEMVLPNNEEHLTKELFANCGSIECPENEERLDELEKAVSVVAAGDPTSNGIDEVELEKPSKRTSTAGTQVGDVKKAVVAGKQNGNTASSMRRKSKGMPNSHQPDRSNLCAEEEYNNFIASESDRQMILMKQQNEELDERIASVERIGFGFPIHEEPLAREKIMEGNRRVDSVRRLKGTGGNRKKDDVALADFITGHFKDLFSAKPCIDKEKVWNCVERVITEDQNNDLMRMVSDDEIYEAVFNLEAQDAPGPDGFSGMFFQKSWSLIKNDISTMVREFFQHGYMPDGINHTNLVLIPKMKNPKTIYHFRPTGCCNFGYKVIAQIMVSRMRPLLTECISLAQSAFVVGRKIQDNMIIAHEAFHALRKRKHGNKGVFALKLGLEKAYDQVSWEFMEDLMLKMGFCREWVQLTMTCITTNHFLIMIDGEKKGEVTPMRGLRQLDPLSPCLFILVANTLSILIEKEVENGCLEGYRINKHCPPITHLLFEDDCLLFATADMKTLETILSLLDIFQRATGQTINKKESSILFSPNTPKSLHKSLKKGLGVPLMDTSCKYLGLLTVWGLRKKEALCFVLEKIKEEIVSWKGISLSQVGREVLIKAVASIIPVYAMECFKFPLSFYDEINQLLTGFGWKGMDYNCNSLDWTSWEKLTSGKENGGLGLGNFHELNIALLAKQAWRLLQNPSSLCAKILKGVYFPHDSFLNANQQKSPSWVWRSIHEGLALLKEGLRWNVSNGTQIMVWQDRWLPSRPGFRIQSTMPQSPSISTVKDLFSEDSRFWNYDLLSACFCQEDVEAIKVIPIGRQEIDVKSGYFFLLNKHKATMLWQQKKPWANIGNLSTIPKIKMFMRRACNNSLATSENLYRRHLASSPQCPRCGSKNETVEHVIFFCPASQAVWRASEFGYTPSRIGSASFAKWWSTLVEKMPELKNSNGFSQIAEICWDIWKMRNSWMFDGEREDPVSVWRRAYVRHCDFINENRWTEPPAHAFKIIFDASFIGEEYKAGTSKKKKHKAGLAAMTRVNNGLIVEETNEFVAASTPPMAEAQARALGSELAAAN